MEDLLNAYIYEIKKGTKPMALMTVQSELSAGFVEKIRKNKLAICTQNIGAKDNIFFGNCECIKIVSKFLNKSLSQLSDEEDFILGIMLGYSRLEQCKRYLNRQNLCPFG